MCNSQCIFETVDESKHETFAFIVNLSTSLHPLPTCHPARTPAHQPAESSVQLQISSHLSSARRKHGTKGTKF